MRLFGRDLEGARLIAAPGLSAKEWRNMVPSGGATFLMNTISDGESLAEGSNYLCESLVEAADGYWMIFTELVVTEGLVESAELKSKFKITPYEASLKLRRAEYVSVYEIHEDSDRFEDNFTAFSLGTTASVHGNGTMYMEFRDDNFHVERRVFNLGDDIEAVYYLTDYGQLVVAAYSYEAISTAETRIASSALRSDIYPTNKYKFLDSVLYDFARSGYDDFNEFIKILQ